MTAKHSPGPWVIETHVESMDGVSRDVALVINGDVIICQVIGAVSINGECHTQNDANARLIATAPDLLAALKKCVEWRGNRHFESPENPDALEPAEAQYEDIAQAMRAIAKAEGRP